MWDNEVKIKKVKTMETKKNSSQDQSNEELEQLLKEQLKNSSKRIDILMDKQKNYLEMDGTLRELDLLELEEVAGGGGKMCA